MINEIIIEKMVCSWKNVCLYCENRSIYEPNQNTGHAFCKTGSKGMIDTKDESDDAYFKL